MRTIKNLVGAFLIAIAIFLVWAVVLPDYDQRSYLQTAIQARQANFDEKSNLISKVESLDKEYQSKYAELKRLSLVVPSEKHVEELITILEQIFSTTGIPLKNMTLSASEGQAGSKFGLVGMEFNFSTTYDSVLNFLTAIEKSLRLIDTSDFRVGIDKDSIRVKGGPQMLSVGFKAKAYYLAKEVKAAVIKPGATLQQD